ncbi:MAG: hypothetical protein ACO3C1_10025 [Ilumatobacteraceae bacterium]
MARVPFFPLDVPVLSTDAVLDAAKELGYVAVGFGVLGFQRAQVRRREIERALRPVTRIVGATVSGVAGAVESVAQTLPCTGRDQAK